MAAVAVVVALAGPAAYTLATVSTAYNGAIPSAGPANLVGFGPGGQGPGGPGGGPGGGAAGGGTFAGRPGGTGAVGGQGFGGTFGGTGGFGPPGGAPGGAVGRGGAGGLLNGSTPSASLTAALKQNSSRYTWVAAAIGSNQASGYQLATGDPVMAIGGFNGTDPAPTLAQFERYVQEGKIHYFIGGGGGPGGGGAPGGAVCHPRAARSPPGWKRTSRPRPSLASPSTT